MQGGWRCGCGACMQGRPLQRAPARAVSPPLGVFGWHTRENDGARRGRQRGARRCRSDALLAGTTRRRALQKKAVAGGSKSNGPSAAKSRAGQTTAASVMHVLITEHTVCDTTASICGMRSQVQPAAQSHGSWPSAIVCVFLVLEVLSRLSVARAREFSENSRNAKSLIVSIFFNKLCRETQYMSLHLIANHFCKLEIFAFFTKVVWVTIINFNHESLSHYLCVTQYVGTCPLDLSSFEQRRNPENSKLELHCVPRRQ